MHYVDCAFDVLVSIMNTNADRWQIPSQAQTPTLLKTQHRRDFPSLGRVCSGGWSYGNTPNPCHAELSFCLISSASRKFEHKESYVSREWPQMTGITCWTSLRRTARLMSPMNHFKSKPNKRRHNEAQLEKATRAVLIQVVQ